MFYSFNKVTPTESNPPAFSRASIAQSGTNLSCDLSKYERNVNVKAIGTVMNI